MSVKLTYEELENRIQELEQTESILRNQKERFSALSSASFEAIFLSDKGICLDQNSTAKKMFGYSNEDAIGRPGIEWIAPDDREQVQTNMMSNFEQPYQVKALRKDGTTFVAEIQARLVTIGERKIRVTALRDITERKKTEDELRENKEKYQSLTNNINIGIYRNSAVQKGRVIETNLAMIKMFGFDSRDEFLKLQVSDLYANPSDRNQFNLKMLEKGEVRNEELQLRKKDGTIFTASISSVVVKDEKGNHRYYDGIIEDITERKQTEKKLKQLQKQMAQSQKMEAIGTLAGGIAHDFNNILFPIMGHTEMLLNAIHEDSPYKSSLDKILQSSLRARDLIQQILTFSRQENKKLEMIQIQPIIKEALKLLRSAIPATIEIKSNIQDDCRSIKSDPTRIHQIIINLATNAYHAMEKTSGQLKVSLKEVELLTPDLINSEMRPGIFACLTVSDTGIGMDTELAQKIFDPFFTTKERGKGTGMGLSVVHGIVKDIKGDIQVDSEPGKGTQFNVYMPIAKTEKETKTTNKQSPVQHGTEHILLVDDEKIIIEMEQEMLELMGYKVTSRTSSVEALEAFQNNPDKFDLVITDMTMPNMSGDELSAELITVRPDIPILLCTGFSNTMSDDKAAFLGIQGFLLKPIVMQDLSHKIREVLDNNKSD